MKPLGRTGGSRWLLLGLALSIAPALSSCASLGLFQADAPTASEPPPQPPVVAEPPRPAEFPELAVGAQIVDAPGMAEMTEASEPQVASEMPPAPNAMPRRPAPNRQASAQPTNPPATAPRTIEPSELVGYNFDSVLAVLRQPDAVERNALSVVWTYSGSDCTLQLYFYPDIQTAVFRLLKYELKRSSGERLNDGGACMQPMMAMRKDGSQSQR
jgi:hypothetical protein